MKYALALSLFASTLSLIPVAHARPNAHPAPAPEPVQDAAKPVPPSFWMAADPHVPLAVVDGKAIRSVGKRGKDCGALNRWAKPKSRWKAVDAFGQITGTFEVAGSELYDVTQCNEVSFAPKGGKSGAGLFVSEDSAYKPGESVAYVPSIAEKKRFDRFLGTMESAFVNHRPLGKPVPLGKRTIFFQFAPPKDPSGQQTLDGAGKAIQPPTRWAVVGGPILVVAYLGDKGRWKAATVKMPLGLQDSYTPVGVFDMNGDGIPEIVYQSADGPSFGDAVLSLRPDTLVWEDAAESPGGATL
jgi:hypothetical protein